MAVMTPGEVASDLLEIALYECKTFDEVGKRIVANRIVGELFKWLPEPKKQEPVQSKLEPMSDEESKAYGDTRMEFGKFVGQRIDEVDRGYLEWLADSGKETWQTLNRYLNSPRVKAESATGTELDDW